jgi:hypothetical protein
LILLCVYVVVVVAMANGLWLLGFGAVWASASALGYLLIIVLSILYKWPYMMHIYMEDGRAAGL